MLFANKRDIRLTEISQSRNTLSKTTIVVKFLEDAAALDFILSEDKVGTRRVASGTRGRVQSFPSHHAERFLWKSFREFPRLVGSYCS